MPRPEDEAFVTARTHRARAIGVAVARIACDWYWIVSNRPI